MPSKNQDLLKLIRQEADPRKIPNYQRFFKTGPGQYGEGDQFLGLTVPQQRKIAQKYIHLSLNEIWDLLASPWHEERLIALLILTEKYPKASPKEQDQIIEGYLANRKWINQWDLVDTSAYKLLGTHLLNRHLPLSILTELADSPSLWDRRIAIIASFAFIKAGQAQPSFTLSDLLLNDPEDLIHKAVGWMLREVGNKLGKATLKDYLTPRYRQMPRTMLRYAIEKWPQTERQQWAIKPATKE